MPPGPENENIRSSQDGFRQGYSVVLTGSKGNENPDFGLKIQFSPFSVTSMQPNLPKYFPDQY